MADDWERLRTTFDAAAELYQQARPEYPEPLYDTLVNLTGIGTGDRVVEVGCATGKATLPLARRGLRITCVEIGPELASAARRNLTAFPNVEVIDGVGDLAATGKCSVRPCVCCHGLALDRPGCALPAGVGAAPPRRAPRLLVGHARVPRRR
jgi:SAM-dependent methyltransferase